MTVLRFSFLNVSVLCLLVAVFFFSFSQISFTAEESIVVIAHPGLAVDNLSFAELRKIFLGDRLFWSEDLTITLLIPAPKSWEREVMLRKIYEKTEAQYRHYWIAKVFRTEAATPPKTVSSIEMMGELIRAIPGSISVVDSSQIPSGVKVLRVDGKGLNDPNYALR